LYLYAVRVTRGGFLRLCSLALGAPLTDGNWIEAIGRASAIAPGRVRDVRPFDLLRAEPDDFRAVMLTEFLVSHSTSVVSARVCLANVTDGQPDARIVQFSVTFTGHVPALPDGTYTFHHDTLGDFELFIVPRPRLDSTVAYHATISRMRET
jgi:hypothetical protein